MRKTDIKPGRVYAYRQNVSNEIVPLVFLANENRVGTLRQDARGYGDRAFKRPRGPDRKPQAGTVYNDGTIGYPAVIFTVGRRRDVRDIGGLITLRDFDAATSPHGNGTEFTLVTSMARVVGEWAEETSHA